MQALNTTIKDGENEIVAAIKILVFQVSGMAVCWRRVRFSSWTFSCGTAEVQGYL